MLYGSRLTGSLGVRTVRMNLTRNQSAAERLLLEDAKNENALNSSLLKLERAESAKESITASIETYSFSQSQNDKMMNALSSINESIECIKKSAESFGKSFVDVECVIENVEREDAKAGGILRRRYIDRASISRIANEAGVSRKHVYTLIRKGLDTVYDSEIKGRRE